MMLSRLMHKEDEFELRDEGQLIIDIHNAIQMWNDKQHHARTWEYAIAVHALREVFGDRKGLLVADHGCGAGYLGPMLYWIGQHVKLYECWTFGNEEAYMLEQMRRVGLNRKETSGSFEMRSRPLGALNSTDYGVDAAFCISTIEHIKNYQDAFRDLCHTVKPGGLAFITCDFGEHEKDDYEYAHLRAGKMFNKNTLEELQSIGEVAGFSLLGEKDWNWSEECRLVMDYGFGSLAMTRTR